MNADENRDLLERVRPPGWRNPTPAGRYNLVVIGGGTAGLVAAFGAAGLGARVALVERDRLGGDCLNVGCVPSKALLRSAHAAAFVRRAERLGVRVTGDVHADFAAAAARMRRERARLASADSAERLTSKGVDVFFGEARFVGPDAVAVEGAELRFARACIATGTRPVVPPIDGLAEAGYLSNETVFDLDELPRRIAVLGGGPIGCELAQAFAGFGADVALIESGDQVLGREDKDAAELVGRALERDGVRVLLGRELRSVARADATTRRLTVRGPDGEESLDVDALLIAVGRAPQHAGLDLDRAGVDANEHGIVVDDRLRTTNRRIFAAGDACLRERFTHAADASARIVVRNALFFGRRRKSALVIPWCTYTDPELARVGLSERAARDEGRAVSVFRVDLADVDRAVVDGETEGYLSIVTDARGGRILGATLVAPHAGEGIVPVAAAMVEGCSLVELADRIVPYPTYAEALRKAADAANRARLTPRRAAWLRRLLAWRR